MKKMMDIVPRRAVLEEQSKKQKRKTRKLRGGKLREKVRERAAKRRKRKAIRRERRSGERRSKTSKEKGSRVWLFSFSRVVFILGILVVVIAAVFVVLTLSSKLTLTLTFAQETVAIEDEVEVNIDEIEINVEDKVIPGKFFEIEKEKWEIFASTGSVKENVRAEGVVRVYNSHNPPRPVALVEKTRFLSSGGGKIFRAPDRIYLPPATVEGGKVIPSVTEIKVVADGAGDGYNIEPSKFSVPGLAGAALYYTIWAESEEKMRGGEENMVTKITEGDLKNAKIELAIILRNSAVVVLHDKVPSEFVLDESAIVEDDIETTCFKTAETIAPDFNCYGKIKLKGLAFKTEDLKSIAFGFLSAVKPSSKELMEESLEVSSAVRGEAAKAGRMVLSISAEVKSFEQLNKDLLFYQVYGKKAENIRKVILDNFPQIGKVELRFWPFWVKTAPKDTERIKIDLTF